ncbi:MAG TPA: YbhN family protein [Gemmatimonadaceae bacterium]|nr:YbhN family protein [Gemmatimonadaceae bacterium]
MLALLLRCARAARNAYLAAEEKPLLIVLVAAGATVAVAVVLGALAGWPRVRHVMYQRHSWSWLLVCLLGELVAYGGYVLTVRDMARVDEGPELDLSASVTTVVGGFGVFAATRGSGGFAVDYWALRKAGSSPEDATRRVLGLTFLEYVVLSVGALIASALLYFSLDGHASDGVTLPSLVVVPILGIGLWLTAPHRAKRFSRLRGNWFKRTFADSVAGAARVRGLMTSPREHGLGVLGNVCYWGGDILCLWAAIQLVNGHLTVAKLVVAYSGGYVLTRRALPAGGAGIVEVALTLALAGLGMHFGRALLAVVVYRLFNFWLPIVPALACMPALRELRSRFAVARTRT